MKTRSKKQKPPTKADKFITSASGPGYDRDLYRRRDGTWLEVLKESKGPGKKRQVTIRDLTEEQVTEWAMEHCVPDELRNRFASATPITPAVAAKMVEAMKGDVHDQQEELSARSLRLSCLARGLVVVSEHLHGGRGCELDGRTSGFILEFSSIIADDAQQLNDEVEAFGHSLLKAMPRKS